MRKQGVNHILQIFFPKVCPICTEVLDREQEICQDCRKKLKYITEPKCKNVENRLSLWMHSRKSANIVEIVRKTVMTMNMAWRYSGIMMKSGNPYTGLNIKIREPMPVFMRMRCGKFMAGRFVQRESKS